MMKFDFLFCSERSGSNLITKMMDAHPQICGPFPTQLMLFFIPALYKYGDISKGANWKILLEDIAMYLNSMHSIWKCKFDVDTLLKNIKERSFKAIHTYVYEEEARIQGKSRLFIKDNHAYLSAGYIEAAFDKPKYVWLVRDPRDALVPLLENGILQGGTKRLCEFWSNDQRGFLNAYSYLKTEERIIQARFEDLLSDTENVLKKICGFLEVNFDKNMLNFYQKDLTKDNSSNVSAWNDLQKPVIKNNFGLYKEKLHEVQIKYIEANCMELMDYLGYKREFKQYEDMEALEQKLTELPEQKAQASDEEKDIFLKWSEARKTITSRKLY